MKNKSITHVLQGGLHIEIHGIEPERFLSLCAKDGIVLREIACKTPERFTAWISAGDFFRMRRHARRLRCRVLVLEKRGIPFALKNVVGRRGLWIGAVLCAAAVIWLSSFVWTIRVEGCQTLQEQEILAALAEAGLKTGTRRSTLAIRDVKTDVLTRLDRLSYLTINFKGIGAIVHVWERRITPERLAEDVPCDVISTRTGVILRLRVRMGKAEVGIGDTVEPGTKLASGTVISAQGEVTLLHAVAEADVRTWYTIRAALPKEIVTGKGREGTKRASLILGSRRFPLDRIENHDDPCYDKRIEQKALRLHEDFRWPVKLEYERIWTPPEEPAFLTREQAAALLEERMLLRLKNALPEGELVHHRFDLEEKDGAYMGVLRVEMIETTGQEVPLIQR